MISIRRRPVLVGCGQVKQRLDDPAEALEPLELMEEALRLAGEDAGAPGLLTAADAIWVARGVWDYSNPAALLKQRLAAGSATTGLSPISGSSIQQMINRAARAIETDQLDVVLIAGGEAEHSKRRALARGDTPHRTEQLDSAPELDLGDGGTFLTEEELTIGMARPASVYSLFENAIRFERGESLELARRRVSELWAGFSRVAARNPHAWDRVLHEAEEIRSESSENPMIAYPYTRRMVANMVVDQAAAVMICSSEAADRFGVPTDRRVYLHAATEFLDTPKLSHRANFHSMEAQGRAGRRVLELTGIDIDDIRHLDIYSCFPSAVQIAARELGIGLDPIERPLTLTGGLNFGGGPFNSYVLHAVASAMDAVRADPGGYGMVTSIGGWISKIVFEILSTRPPEHDFAFANLDDEADCLARREVAHGIEAPATIESFSLNYLRGAPHQVVAACRLDDDRRIWAASNDPETLEAFRSDECCGTRVELKPERRFTLA